MPLVRGADSDSFSPAGNQVEHAGRGSGERLTFERLRDTRYGEQATVEKGKVRGVPTTPGSIVGADEGYPWRGEPSPSGVPFENYALRATNADLSGLDSDHVVSSSIER